MDLRAVHGGDFFRAIGLDFRHLSRSGEVISADVLDAWFDPAPILPGAGSSSLIFACLPVLIDRGARVLVLDPMYGEYAHFAASQLDANLVRHELAVGNGFAVDTDSLIRGCTPILRDDIMRQPGRSGAPRSPQSVR